MYLEAVGTTIVRAISVAREKYNAKIKTKLTQKYSDYSSKQAIRDVQEYHRRCSFYYGLVEISKSLDQRKKTKAEIENDIRGLVDNAKILNKNGLAIDKEIKEKVKSLLMQRPEAPE